MYNTRKDIILFCMRPKDKEMAEQERMPADTGYKQNRDHTQLIRLPDYFGRPAFFFEEGQTFLFFAAYVDIRGY